MASRGRKGKVMLEERAKGEECDLSMLLTSLERSEAFSILDGVVFENSPLQ